MAEIGYRGRARVVEPVELQNIRLYILNIIDSQLGCYSLGIGKAAQAKIDCCYSGVFIGVTAVYRLHAGATAGNQDFRRFTV